MGECVGGSRPQPPPYSGLSQNGGPCCLSRYAWPEEAWVSREGVWQGRTKGTTDPHTVPGHPGTPDRKAVQQQVLQAPGEGGVHMCGLQHTPLLKRLQVWLRIRMAFLLWHHWQNQNQTEEGCFRSWGKPFADNRGPKSHPNGGLLCRMWSSSWPRLRGWTKTHRTQILCQLCKSGVPSSNDIRGWDSRRGSSSYHSHGNPRWMWRCRRGLQKTAKAKQGDQRQLGHRLWRPWHSRGQRQSHPIQHHIVNPILVTSESTLSKRWRGCHRVGFGSRIIHQSLPTGPTKCNLCHKSRHGVIVSKIDSKKWM